jgi:hypothetical protein
MDLDHRLEGKVVEPGLEREPGGQLRRDQVAHVEHQGTSGSGVELSHEVQDVQRSVPAHHHRVLERQRDRQRRGHVEGVRGRHLQPRRAEGRRKVEVAGQRLPVDVPPGDVVPHPGRAHRAGMSVERGEPPGRLELGPGEVEVHRMEEDREPRAGLEERRKEARLLLGLLERQWCAVLHDVEQLGLGGMQRPGVGLHGRVEVAGEAEPEKG